MSWETGTRHALWCSWWSLPLKPCNCGHQHSHTITAHPGPRYEAACDTPVVVDESGFRCAHQYGKPVAPGRTPSPREPGGECSRCGRFDQHARWCEYRDAGRTPSRAEKVAALRAALDSLDEQTRLPGESPLRDAVAQQARERLAEMDERKRDA